VEDIGRRRAALKPALPIADEPRVPARSALALVAASAAIVLFGSVAGAGVTPGASASALAQAIAHNSAAVAGSELVSAPPSGRTNGISDSRLAGFPVDGPTYAVLTTGDATSAARPNDAPDTSGDGGGASVRGDSDFDVTILRIDVSVPQGANCLSFDFKFLTEEFPEYVGREYNDAFIAELDGSDWSDSGSAITAASNFAFDPTGSPISVNAAGATTVNAANAAGTTYDGATPMLRASKQISPGEHSLFLSIFDSGDAGFDSAVFVDNLVVGSASGGNCKPGATLATGGGGSAQTPVATATTTGSVLVDGRPFDGGSVAYGSTVDVTRGALDLRADVGRVRLYGQGTVPARFKIARARIGGAAVIELRLASNRGSCGGRALAARTKKDKPLTRLWGSGKGRFRTKTQFVAATVKGTIWKTEDSCSGSLVAVRRGVVSVTDLVKRKTLAVGAGRSYFARAPRR
jgi:hypothetical protein